MQIEASITKDAINLMPLCWFEGKIIVVDKKSELKKALEYLQTQTILGFDTETKPTFARGAMNKVALMQISSENVCYLFRLNKIGFPADLQRLLKDATIKKIGLSLKDDFAALNKRKLFNPESFIDLQNIAKDYGITDLSLQKIFALLFGCKISKSQRLSNWEAETLTEAQMKYAATDAWASREIYMRLMKMRRSG